jgi:tagaturonate reductase
VLKYAELWSLGDKFAEWIRRENVFANTLVDRINTGYPRGEELNLGYEDKMLNTSEYFHLWVIESDCDIERELPFSKAGLNVIITKDKLEMYRTRKVRILNGAHTSCVAHAMLSGIETVGDFVADEKTFEFMRKNIFDEIIPTLDLPRAELEAYAESVLERFRNPYIRHLWASISLNSVSKFKVRVLPSVLEYEKRFGRAPENLIFSLKRLIELYKTDFSNDSAEVLEFMKKSDICEILKNEKLWGEDISRFAKLM